MSRIQILKQAEAPKEVAKLYDAVQKKLGMVPNMVKTLGRSHSGLLSYLNLSAAVSSGVLRPSTREKIALLVAEENNCDYCLSAHTAIGNMLKIPTNELDAARQGASDEAHEQAVLNLTREILNTRGSVSDIAYNDAVAAGISEEETVEIVANVALNVLTNYFNRLAQTDIDFPKVKAATCTCPAS